MRILLNRRDWLRLSLLGAVGSHNQLWSGGGANQAFRGFGKAKSVVVFYTGGGMSQFESWDPKPNAPAEIRGEFGTIPTSVVGVRLAEHLPKVAQIADQLTIVRSMTHDDTDHGSATYAALTGFFHARKSSNPLPTPQDMPTMGAVLKKVRPHPKLPHTALHLNGPLLAPELPAVGQFGGLLGRGHEPFVIGDALNHKSYLQSMLPDPDVPTLRLEARQELLSKLDSLNRSLDASQDQDRLALQRQALELLNSTRYREAFELEREPQRIRDQYGWYRTGQACLLARRLVEVGVPYITVFCNQLIRGQDKAPEDTNSYGWDTHNDIFESLRDHLLPRFDQTFSTFIKDLQQRGLLESTLVVCMGEFGRAPLVAHEARFAGNTPGRKHWAACYSIVLAGAGVKRGAVFGASDKSGAYPSLNPVSPSDMSATIFAALGIDPSQHYKDNQDRPYIISNGKPVSGLWE
jgi:hypothetical protein